MPQGVEGHVFQSRPLLRRPPDVASKRRTELRSTVGPGEHQGVTLGTNVPSQMFGDLAHDSAGDWHRAPRTVLN